MTIALWRGEFGNEYTLRNPVTPEKIRQREKLWGRILNAMLPARPKEVVEFGANVGINMLALQTVLSPSRMIGIEPNEKARSQISSVPGQVYAWGEWHADADPCELSFTSGVLIHIPPDELLAFCKTIYDASTRWIVAIEYFSHEPQEVMYRGEMGRLFKRDFGAFYLDNFPDLMPIGCGFAWSRMTGLDDLHWWAFEKR